MRVLPLPAKPSTPSPPAPLPKGERRTAVAAMPEIEEAQGLLAALAESDEAKAADAALPRCLKLQTDYGQAMMYSKGYVLLEETRTAFADVLEDRGRDNGRRGAICRVLWNMGREPGSGDLTLALQMAETFRREAEDEAQRPKSGPEPVSVGGLTLLTQGDLARARAQLEEALRFATPVGIARPSLVSDRTLSPSRRPTARMQLG